MSNIRDQLKALKREANEPKSRLISLANKVRDISPYQASELEKVIIKLEVWQSR